ncbi:MAG: hypothetical protein AAFV59_14280 [Pseudomonadota bacterium]
MMIHENLNNLLEAAEKRNRLGLKSSGASIIYLLSLLGHSVVAIALAAVTFTTRPDSGTIFWELNFISSLVILFGLLAVVGALFVIDSRRTIRDEFDRLEGTFLMTNYLDLQAKTAVDDASVWVRKLPS